MQAVHWLPLKPQQSHAREVKVCQLFVGGGPCPARVHSTLQGQTAPACPGSPASRAVPHLQSLSTCCPVPPIAHSTLFALAAPITLQAGGSAVKAESPLYSCLPASWAPLQTAACWAESAGQSRAVRQAETRPHNIAWARAPTRRPLPVQPCTATAGASTSACDQ